MAISNLEFAVMAPKTQTVTQLKQPELQKPIVEQNLIREEFNKMVQHNGTQTVKTSKSDNTEYRYDAKEKGKDSYTGTGKKKQSSKEKEKKRYNNSRPGSIDIKV